MKPSILELLCCPSCGAELHLSVAAREGEEVLEGRLGCAVCRADYPVRRGVPRFTHGEGYAASFGYQWNRFRSVQLDSRNGTSESEKTLQATTGWGDEDYHGRLVLDAGVGAGRYAEVVAVKGGEVVGLDLTDAIEAAYRNIGRRPGVHLLQADIFSMPFRPRTFDLVYSIGVLHHTPDPRTSFERVAAMVKEGGSLAVYVYPHPGVARRFPDTIRIITTRLPVRLVCALAALAVPLYALYRLPVLGKVLQLVCPISMHPSWRVRWLDTFDWYTPRHQWKLTHPEVFRWFRSCGFRDIEIAEGPIRMRGTKVARAGAIEAPCETASRGGASAGDVLSGERRSVPVIGLA